MINLPFKVAPGVADRYITEASYINNSFIVVEDFEGLRDLLNTSKYRPAQGTPIFVNKYGKIYKYVEGQTDISMLPNFDFLKEDLTPGTIYGWKDNAYYNLSGMFSDFATKEDLNELRSQLQEQFAEQFAGLSNKLNEEIEDRKNADLSLRQDIQSQLATFQNNLNSIELSLISEVNRATQVEQQLQKDLTEETERSLQAEATLNQKVDDALADLGGQYDSLFGEFDGFKKQYAQDYASVEDRLSKNEANLTSEIARAQGEESDLQNKISQEQQRAEKAEQSNYQLLLDEIQIRTAQDARIDQNISVLQSSLSEEIANRVAADSTERLAREQGDQQLEEKINQEIADRAQADATLQNGLDSEIQNRTSADQDLQNGLDGEIQRATQVEGSLQDQLGSGFDSSNTVADAIKNINSNAQNLSEALNKEVEDRKSADQTLESTLQSKIDDEAQAREAKDAELSDTISDEISRAKQAEQEINDKIGAGFDSANTVASAIEENKNNIQNNQSSIEKEIERAKAAESAIAGNLSTETSQRTAADTALQESIANETQAREEKDTQLQSAIEDEAKRATAAEQANAGSIAAETSRATQAESDLQSKIDSEAQTAREAEQQNADNIVAEQKRAQAAESSLTEQITDATSNLNGLVESTKQDLEAEIQQSASEHSKINQRLGIIESKIPTQASATNQLADKAFVNSSIQANAARFLTPTADGKSQWSSFDLLKQGPWYYEGMQTEPTNNDYAVFIKSEAESSSGAKEQWRALFQKSEGSAGEWAEQYKMGSAFTNAQQQAVDSGITSDLVTQIGTNQTDIANLQTSLQDHIKDTADKYVKKVDPTFSGTMTPVIGSKIDFSQSTTLVRDPIADNEAANKSYVDSGITSSASSTLSSAKKYTDDAIGGLDSTIEEEADKYIASITETNGKITGTKKPLPVTRIAGTAPISVSSEQGVYTITHDARSVQGGTQTGATTFLTGVTADTTGHLASYKINTLEDALKSLGVITIFGGTAADLV